MEMHNKETYTYMYVYTCTGVRIDMPVLVYAKYARIIHIHVCEVRVYLSCTVHVYSSSAGGKDLFNYWLNGA